MNLKIASISKIVLLVLILITLSAPLAFSQESENESQAVPANQLPLFDGVPTVRTDIHHDVSLPLRDLAAIAPQPVGIFHEAQPVRRIPLPAGMRAAQLDEALQTGFVPASPTVSHSFDGIGQGVFGFAVNSAPPDTNGAVGSTQYVQWVNSSFAVFNKSTGALVAGPTGGNALWTGFGGGCETNNDGDPIVLYDKLANRWVFSQFSVSTTPFLQCVAVSTTSDATGTFNRYSFQYSNFDDYPKMGVWPDAYYETFNMFNGNTFVGSDACAYNRNAMLNGQPATQVCFQQNSSVGGLLPADLDGTTPPPAGSPNFLLFFGNNNVNLFKFHVDFTTPSNSRFTGPTTIPVAAFSPLCGGGTCVPQSGTSQQLDSLADRLMYRLAYRNLGSHESLVVNHSVTAGSSGGVRWYEIQNPNGTPTLAQQGTFAPDSSFRWMGSMAMDQAGDIAVGYSVSSSSLHPSIAFTGRTPSDPSGTLEAETNIITGGGSQTGSNLSRWGDYSALTVDPVDDCTFWFTTEYLKASGAFNWNTRIANFKFPNCGSVATPDFAVAASPASQTIIVGSSTTYTATVSSINGFTGTVSFGVGGLPTGATSSFNPTSVSGGSGSSTLTVSTSSSTPPGTYTLTITGTNGTTSHSAQVTLVVNSTAVCVTSTAGTGFHDTPLPAAQTGTFTATFDATPSASPINSVVALSHGAQTTFNGFATLVRFNPSGNIDARNGGSYKAASIIPYTGGLTYHFRLVINIPAHTYSIFVTPPGSTELTVGSNFAFRSTQSTVTSLDFWGTSASSGSDKVCNFTIR